MTGVQTCALPISGIFDFRRRGQMQPEEFRAGGFRNRLPPRLIFRNVVSTCFSTSFRLFSNFENTFTTFLAIFAKFDFSLFSNFFDFLAIFAKFHFSLFPNFSDNFSEICRSTFFERVWHIFRTAYAPSFALLKERRMNTTGVVRRTKHRTAVGRQDRKSTRLNSSHRSLSRMPSSA